MNMIFLKLIILLLSGVKTGKCGSWTLTLYFGEVYVSPYSFLRIYFTVGGEIISEVGSLVSNEERTLSVDVDYGKINSVTVAMHCIHNINCYKYTPVYWIHIQKVVAYDGIRTYRFPCDCILPGSVQTKTIALEENLLEIDPCLISTPEHIPNVRMYNPDNTQPVVPSITLTEGWYTGGQYRLLTKGPDLDLPRCGAESQIWMNDTIPYADGLNHPRQLCITNRTTGDTCVYNMTAYVTKTVRHTSCTISVHLPVTVRTASVHSQMLMK
ncbi:uncharacterized protein [Argopecten irradians]|uniref:uncharacterized protein n=1 Tax=Argopecten irradians TaxID=31199 RepID=UPI00371472BA